MIKNWRRATAAAAFALLPLTLLTPARAAGSAPAAARAPETAAIGVAVGRLAVTTEDRTGYERDSFRHWNTGLDPDDGCNTRAEVLIAEAVEPPSVGARCALTGGSWFSYYDGLTVTPAGALDIDHMVPLAEAWDSGASAWTPARREAYANDQGAATSLIAVTARTNRQKSDQDPAQWLPPAENTHCRYLAEWTATKLRWNLTVDEAEQDRLFLLAAGCPGTTVTYEPAP
ncbi:HNH endonuclease family protein [Streptomyces sp. NPDC001985]|uniref:HNH endonuclease family protein n=1 Tax=Streptomyces sp. NPDC001985 TaxID=3154406 RepID=UPI00332DC73C